MRIFIGLHEIAGYYSRLIGAFEEDGIKVTFLAKEPHPFGYETKQAPQWLQKWTHFSMDSKGSYFSRNISKLFLVLYLALTHKVFIFSCASSFDLFRPYGELALLKFLRRRIIFVLHGSDSRPSFMERYGLATREGKTISGRALSLRIREVVSGIHAFERYADYVIANPLSSQWHRKPCINWFLIGLPAPKVASSTLDRSTTSATRASPSSTPPLILHSPSDPIGKGTPLIRKAIADLRESGRKLQYVELSGRPHWEVLETLEKCSFVIDQLYSDQPMAGLASEAAAFGKASIVGSYGWAALHTEAGMDGECYPPVIESDPDNIQETITKALDHPQWLESIGADAMEFVDSRWSPAAVASRFKKLFHGQPDSDWWFSPENTSYHLGCTVRPIEIIIMVRTLLALDSSDCLGLDDKPKLKESLIRMAIEPQTPETEIALDRIVALEKLLAKHEEKLDNFRGMIDRRNQRISKLERKLGIQKEPGRR